jgi:hypothetical protein
MVASTILISAGPKPVNVRLCFKWVNPGPIGPCRSVIGAPTEGLLSRENENVLDMATVMRRGVNLGSASPRAELFADQCDRRQLVFAG